MDAGLAGRERRLTPGGPRPGPDPGPLPSSDASAGDGSPDIPVPPDRLSQSPRAGQARKARSLGRVAAPVGKGVKAADRVDMGTAGNGHHRFIRFLRIVRQAHAPKAEIEPLHGIAPAPGDHRRADHRTERSHDPHQDAGGHRTAGKPARHAAPATTRAAAASAPGPCGMSSAIIPASITASAPSVMWAFTWPIWATRRKP